MNAADTTAARSAVCLGCGCLCDDLVVRGDPPQLDPVGPPCGLAAAWLARHASQAARGCHRGGQTVETEVVIAAAVEALARAKYPLIYGLVQESTETLRAAVALAEQLGGAIDLEPAEINAAAAANLGIATATWGEVRHRADLIVIFAADPVVTHPRHFERYSANAVGRFTPRGRASRRVIYIGSRSTATAAEADQVIELAPERMTTAIGVLTAIVMQHASPGGLPLDPEAVETATGIALETWSQLASTLEAASYSALLFGGAPFTGGGGKLATQALIELVRGLHRVTRAVAMPLVGGGNPTGAENVLAWQTGYAGRVDFSRGYPRSCADVYSSRRLLARRAVDLAVIVGSDPLGELSPAEVEDWQRVETIVLSSRATETFRQASIGIAIAAVGWDQGGVVYRSDEAALVVPQLVTSERAAGADVLSRLAAGVQSRLASAAPSTPAARGATS